MFYKDTASDVKDVFLYIRQSTDEKSGKQVRSMGDQRQDCEDMAAFLGLNIVEVFQEDQSAKRPHNRPIFKSMMKELSFKSPEKRRADGVLAWHPDRLSRNALEAGQILQMLDDDLIKNMYFPAYSFHNDPSGKEHLFIEFARAKGYSDRLSVAVLRGSTGREKEGAYVHGRDKFGYQKRREVPENPKLCSLFPEPCPVNYAIIQRIFALRLEGLSVESIIALLRSEGVNPNGATLTKSHISKCLSDPFYHGRWVINANQKEERVVDLTTITLHDGTQFQPVVSEAQFWKCQRWLEGPGIKQKLRKHINPIHGEIFCQYCGGRLRPARRKIKRAGQQLISQLGYECHSKQVNSQKCPQSRVKAEYIFDYIEITLKHVSVEKKDYHRFLVGLEAFLAKKKKSMKIQRAKVTKAFNTLEVEKKKLLHRKAVLAENGDLGSDDREFFTEELARVNFELAAAQQKKFDLGKSDAEKIASFREFIERCQNLHGEWNNADEGKKREISKKILLNLTIKDREVQSVTWKKPYAEWLNGQKFHGGEPIDTNIEPRLNRLWNVFHSN